MKWIILILGTLANFAQASDLNVGTEALPKEVIRRHRETTELPKCQKQLETQAVHYALANDWTFYLVPCISAPTRIVYRGYFARQGKSAIRAYIRDSDDAQDPKILRTLNLVDADFDEKDLILKTIDSSSATCGHSTRSQLRFKDNRPSFHTIQVQSSYKGGKDCPKWETVFGDSTAH